ncbi:MAG: hypothetical protein EXR79_01145 [Myxococcales bacterium]|nr:hypothetical protein [Myxococcales bacterium]
MRGVGPFRSIARAAGSSAAIAAAFGVLWGHDASAAAPSVDLLAQIQPLRPRLARPQDAPPALRLSAVAHARANWSVACTATATLRAERMRTAAGVFFGAQRADADLAGIDRFLTANVRGPTPLFEITAEVLVAARLFRALGVDSCVRAGRPDLALPFVASLGGIGQDALARVALAVVRVQAAGDWRASGPELAGERGGVHVAVLRALAQGRRRGNAMLIEAERTALAPAEAALVAAARKALDREESVR